MVPLFLLCGLLACDRDEPAMATDAKVAEVSAADTPKDVATERPQEPGEDPGARMIIRTARLELRTEAVGDVANELGTIAERFGGYVERSDGSAAGDAFRTFEATLRIPGDRFESAMAALREQGDVLHETVESSDVTQEYSDLEAHLRSHRALETRLLSLLEQTESVEDALRVEGELVRVRNSIETVEGRRIVMARQVAMSDIAVVLVHPDPPRAPRARTAMTRIDNATDDARDLFIGVIAGLIRIFGAVLPLLLIGGPVAFAAHRGLRRRKRMSAPMPADEA